MVLLAVSQEEQQQELQVPSLEAHRQRQQDKLVIQQ
jgi:hypothetical protein